MLQTVTAPLGNSLVTGSVVNLMLIISVMTCGLTSGLSVAVVSPIMAKFIGIGLLWSLIPFIAAGNVVLVLLWHFIGNQDMGRKYASYIVSLVCAAIIKFLVLYIGIVQIAVPMFLGLSEQQAAVISNMFSISQFFTTLIGGIFAILLLPRLRKAVKGGQS